MDKIMPLDLLSSIKGASSSEAVEELFNVIKGAVTDQKEGTEEETNLHAVPVNRLRDDHIERCTDIEKEIISKNFPDRKNGFLVVPKVIDD